MRNLIARLFRGDVSKRDFARRADAAGSSRASVESVLDTVRPDPESFRAEPYSETTPYRQLIQSDNLPIHTGYFITDLRTIALGDWQRVGARGAHVVVEGAEGTDGAYVCEIAAGARTRPQRYLFEEVIYVLDGEGETFIWHDRTNKRSFRWRKGSLFSPPLNVWREHVNRGTTPARFVSVTDLPIVMDLFHNANFIYNNEFIFNDRYNDQDDYFACGPDKIRKGRAPGVTGRGRGDSYECSLIPDARTLALFEAEARGKKNRTSEIQLADNTLQCHVSEFPVGTYKRAHRHGPGSHVIVIGGRGYSLMWKGDHRFSQARTQMRIDWTDGSLFVPPDQWFHQHFNGGDSAARYMAVTWIGGKYFAQGLGGGGRTHRLGTVSIHDGGNMIDYTDEDPAVREIFEQELRKSGVESLMR